MNHRYLAAALFLLSILGIIVGYFLLHPELIISCPADLYSNCIDQFWDLGIGKPLYWSTRWLPPLFLGLLFVRKEVFTAWWKVVLPISILALIFIVLSPPFPDLLTPDRTTVTRYAVWLIDGVSALVIAWKYWRLSKAR